MAENKINLVNCQVLSLFIPLYTHIQYRINSYTYYRKKITFFLTLEAKCIIAYLYETYQKYKTKIYLIQQTN